MSITITMPTPLQRFKSRVRLGTRLTLVSYQVNCEPKPHCFLGVDRVVGFVGSRQLAFNPPQRTATIGTLEEAGLGRMSYLDWPKASELLWLDADLVLITSKGVQLEYRFD